jgi:hypothetical protein
LSKQTGRGENESDKNKAEEFFHGGIESRPSARQLVLAEWHVQKIEQFGRICNFKNTTN